jgi:hypothetical protein
VQASPLNILIQNGSFVSTLKQNFLQGTPLPQITLVTLGNIAGSNMVIDQVDFSNCYILSVNPSVLPDSTEVIYLNVRYTSYVHTINQYTQNGVLQGKTSSQFDLTKNTSGEGNR